MSLPAAIFVCVIARIVCTASVCGHAAGAICHDKMSKQYKTNAERKIPILHANLFCSAHTRTAFLVSRNSLTKEPNNANLGPKSTFNTKSATIIIVNTSGISYSARNKTRNNDNSHITSVIPVAIRTSFSFTKPYLSVFCERVT